jgi:hypothetical protein
MITNARKKERKKERGQLSCDPTRNTLSREREREREEEQKRKAEMTVQASSCFDDNERKKERKKEVS